MLELLIISSVFFGLSVIGTFSFAVLAGADEFKCRALNISLIICSVVLVLSIVGIGITYNSDANTRDRYLTRVKNIIEAENDLEKFLVDHPQFREECYGKESNSNK